MIVDFAAKILANPQSDARISPSAAIESEAHNLDFSNRSPSENKTVAAALVVMELSRLWGLGAVMLMLPTR